MKELQQQTPPSIVAEEEENSAISLESVLIALRRFWFLVILCAALGGAGAYYYVGKQPYTYSKTASLQMREGSRQADPSERILKELGADSGAASLAMESNVLKSTALMRGVVEKLKLDVGYWTQVKLREVELYKDSPLLAVFSGIDDNRGCRLTVTPLSDTKYSLSYINNAGTPDTMEGTYGSTMEFPFGTVTIHPTPRMSPEWIGRGVIIVRTPKLAVTRMLLASLSVTRPVERDLAILHLTLTATNPRKAEDVLTALIDVYNENSRNERSAAAQKTEAFIRERLAEIGKALETVDRKISESKADANILTDTESTITSDMGTAQGLDKSIFELETQIKLAKTLGEQLDVSVKKDGLISVATGISDAAISARIEGYNEAYLEWRKISDSAGARNPIAIAHREKMEVTLSATKTALANYISNLNLRHKELTDKKREFEKRVEETVTKGKELTPLLREHKVREELYMLLLTKEQENALTLALAEPIARVLESAYGSDVPVAPRTQVFIAAGTVGGGVVCLLAILGIGMLNNKVKTRHDLTAYSTLPVLAELPELSRRERRHKSLFVQDAHSTMAEGLHILRNNVDNFLPRPDGRGHIILLTSSMPNEGKTFCAANLAATYAQTGRKVLLVDADLRKTSLTRDLGGKGRAGLTSLLLRREEDPFKLIHNLPEAVPAAKNAETARKHDGRADILYAGPSVPHPITLLAQPLLGELLRRLAAQYDAVIIDAPPCGIMADTDILAAESDFTLYLVRSGRINRKYLHQVQKLADQGKLPHVAFLINAVDFKANSYNYYGYTYGHYRYGYSDKSNA